MRRLPRRLTLYRRRIFECIYRILFIDPHQGHIKATSRVVAGADARTLISIQE
jgi:hypothetical protein